MTTIPKSRYGGIPAERETPLYALTAEGRDQRATATKQITATVSDGCWGLDVSVAIFESDEAHSGGDRGGVVLKIDSANYCASGFDPYVIQTAHGFEVHVAGDGEANCLIEALREALRDYRYLGTQDMDIEVSRKRGRRS